MLIYRFDGSFEGMLSMVFEAFANKERPDMIVRLDGAALPLFYDCLKEITTDSGKSSRVWAGLMKRVSRSAAQAVATSFLCCDPDFDMPLMRFLCRIFSSEGNIENDFSDPDNLEVLRNCKRVNWEMHNIIKFARFQKSIDGTYFAMMEPRYDVLPMAIPHFSDRFSDSRFILYDRLRDYGYLCERGKATWIRLSGGMNHLASGQLAKDIADPEEELFQELWRTYFHSTAIAERANPRKQRADMPIRFWKYLTEKRR